MYVNQALRIENFVDNLSEKGSDLALGVGVNLRDFGRCCACEVITNTGGFLTIW